MARRFKKDAPAYFDYKDVKTLQRFINVYGQIEPISKTGLSAKQTQTVQAMAKDGADRGEVFRTIKALRDEKTAAEKMESIDLAELSDSEKLRLYREVVASKDSKRPEQFESLTTLRPKMLAALLRSCRKIKVKRLFFVFADRHDHPWRKRLDPAEFNLGRGDRALVKGGRIHPRYRIVVPEEFVATGAGDGA